MAEAFHQGILCAQNAIDKNSHYEAFKARYYFTKALAETCVQLVPLALRRLKAGVSLFYNWEIQSSQNLLEETRQLKKRISICKVAIWIPAFAIERKDEWDSTLKTKTEEKTGAKPIQSEAYNEMISYVLSWISSLFYVAKFLWNARTRLVIPIRLTEC